jgi:hypothetical protein
LHENFDPIALELRTVEQAIGLVERDPDVLLR